MGAKLLEESQELFRSWRKGDGEGILKESAEVLVIILAAIGIYGFKLEDLVAEREKRLRDRGGFLGMQFLEGVGESLPFVEGLEDVPRLILIRRACPPLLLLSASAARLHLPPECPRLSGPLSSGLPLSWLSPPRPRLQFDAGELSQPHWHRKQAQHQRHFSSASFHSFRVFRLTT